MNQVSSSASYSEWVLPSWPSFLPVLLVYPTLWLTFVPFNEPVGVFSGLGLTAAVVALMISKSARITVADGNLTVRHATIGIRFISGVKTFDRDEAFAERGRNLDSRAYVHFQGSVKSLVKVELSDPEDPTPYWLFSSRQPEKLRKVLGF